MCFGEQSIKNGRRSSSSQNATQISTTSEQLVGEAPGRVAIIVNAPPTNYFTISMDDDASLDQGINMYPTNEPLVLTVGTHGDMVTKAWSAVSSSGTQDVTVIEVFLD